MAREKQAGRPQQRTGAAGTASPAGTTNGQANGAADRSAVAAATSRRIATWEDDPISARGQQPIKRPVPTLRSGALVAAIDIHPAPAPKVFAPGTAEFRYWNLADALQRGLDFWSQFLPPGKIWQVGAQLHVALDAGVDLNAYYTRGNGAGQGAGLSFFHSTVAGQVVFSGESPDVICHELGHAVLDTLRPHLWDVMSAEIAAFHESFGDMSAILCALQLPSLRDEVIAETSDQPDRNSRLSRLAEQLGWAIRQGHPDAVDPDCLRNAVNSFFYRDPITLPPRAPAVLLSSEPHSFSRVFTASFFEALTHMAGVHAPGPAQPATAATLLQASHDIAQLLVDAVTTAPVVNAYYSQVAGSMLAADAQRNGGKYRDILKSAFVRHGILAPTAAAIAIGPETMVPQPLALAAGAADGPAADDTPLPLIALPGTDYGFGDLQIVCQAPGQARRIAVTSAAAELGAGPIQPPSEDKAAQAFVEDLFQRGRIDIDDYGRPEARLSHPFSTKTHALVQEDHTLMIRRWRFDCGFDS